MVTKSPSNVIQLKASRSSLYVNINNNTAKKFKPRQKDFYLRDNKLKGFYIRVRPNGKKSYAVEAKRFGNGRKQSYTIGDINLFSAKQAREIAIDNLQKIKSGKNLSAEKNKQATQDKNIQTLMVKIDDLKNPFEKISLITVIATKPISTESNSTNSVEQSAWEILADNQTNEPNYSFINSK